MANDTGEEPACPLDEVDRGILLALQQNARSTTAQEMAEAVGVSASTARNRIENLETVGVIPGYQPVISYERAGYQLRMMFVGTAPPEVREERATGVLSVPGVVDVREMLTSQRNLYVEVVATSTADLTDITSRLSDLGIEILRSEIVTNHYSQPFGELEHRAGEVAGVVDGSGWPARTPGRPVGHRERRAGRRAAVDRAIGTATYDGVK